jgi:GNAT superfamily N-acetyltransferase
MDASINPLPHIEQIPLELALPIRLKAMYPGEEMDAVKLADDIDGIHFGLFTQNKLVSVVSWFRRNEQEAQFRKMATLEEYRNIGYGTLLLTYVIEFSRTENIQSLWCNARVSATKFYKKLGFETSGVTVTKNGIDYIIMSCDLFVR